MMNGKSQCETCAWPLDCSDDMKADKPAGADCPREARVWERRIGETAMALPDDAAFDELADTGPRPRALMLV
ncbi:MAG: hypothetical protein ACM3NQ_11475 [Bacteroidales bacterium]